MFLWHFPSSHPDRTLSCTLPCEARTFLTPYGAQLPGVLRLPLLPSGAPLSPAAKGKTPRLRIVRPGLGGIAQLVEHLHGMQGVRSSSLLASTRKSP